MSTIRVDAWVGRRVEIERCLVCAMQGQFPVIARGEGGEGGEGGEVAAVFRVGAGHYGLQGTLATAVSILLDGEAMVERVRRLIPPARAERADHTGRIVYRSIARYFAGSVMVAVLNGTVILTAGLILGVPLAPLAAVWAAVTNLIPQIGGFLGGSFFVLLATTQSPVTGLIALVVFLAYQQFENNVIQPTVIGRAVHLSPPTTMLAALIVTGIYFAYTRLGIDLEWLSNLFGQAPPGG